MAERHGMTSSAEYGIWCAMKRRCYNKNAKDYKNYGARGIVVCERWRNSFLAFMSDMGPRPAGLTIERRDNDKSYCPENCYWATCLRQCRNRRVTRYFTYNGERLAITEWAERTGISAYTIYARIERGWPADKVLGPRYQRVLEKWTILTVGGSAQPLTAWAKSTGLAKNTIARRIARGWDVASAVGLSSDRNRKVKKPKRVTRGAERHNAKLTEDDVRDILASGKTGILAKTLASKYSVSPSTITDILQRRTWRHVVAK